MNQNKLHYVANNVGLFFICIVLSYAFADQLLQGYGDIVLHLHVYTWSLISFSIILVFIAIGLLLERGFNAKPLHSKLSFGLMAVLECGFFICPDNPTIYNLIRTSV